MSVESCKSSNTLLEPVKITEDFVAHFIKEEQFIKEEPYFKDDSKITIKEEPNVNNDEKVHPDLTYNADSIELLEPKIELSEIDGDAIPSTEPTLITTYKSIENHCYFCDENFDGATNFYDHMLNRHHLDELCFTRKKWSCRACKDNFLKQNCLHDSMEQLQHHIDFCNDEKYNKGPFREAHRFAFVCNLCKCGFGGNEGAYSLSSHFTAIHDNHHAVKEKIDPLLASKRKLAQETLTVKKSKKLERLASSNILIETNTKNLAVKITAFKCNVCLSILPTLDELVKHSKICQGENPFCNSGEKRFHCYVCFKVFPTRGSLLAHKNKQKGICSGNSSSGSGDKHHGQKLQKLVPKM